MSKTLAALLKDMKDREELGLKKYGCTVDREDLTLRDWLQHAYEESLDKSLYLKRAIREIDNLEL
jgi:hypothetical protein